MTTRLAILCPGQGAQHAGMFDLARTDKQTATMLDAWHLDARLGTPLQHVLDHPTLLFSNAMAQPLVVAATLAAWVAIRDLLPKPALVAGYSVGEVAAYAVAESISCEDAIRLAAVRAELTSACLCATRACVSSSWHRLLSRRKVALVTGVSTSNGVAITLRR